MPHPLLTFEHPVGLITADAPRYPSAPGGLEALKRDLVKQGARHEQTVGRYGAPERSLIVHGLPRQHLEALGRKYGQEAVVHSEGGRRHLIYTNGPQAGRAHPGLPGHELHPSAPEDNYTWLPGAGYARLGFDFNRLEPTGGGAEVPAGVAASSVHKAEPETPNLPAQERPTLADDHKPDLRKALFDLHSGLKPIVADYEAQCLALRKAETAHLEKVAPPGFSEAAMHELKRKHGVESAFKIAWAAYDKRSGRKPKAEKSMEGLEAGERPIRKDEGVDGQMGDAGPAPIAGSGALQSAEKAAPLCKLCGMKESEHDCEAAEKYAKGEDLGKMQMQVKGPPTSATAPAPPPPPPAAPQGGPLMLPGEQAHHALNRSEDPLEAYALEGLAKARTKQDPGPIGGAAGPPPTAPAPIGGESVKRPKVEMSEEDEALERYAKGEVAARKAEPEPKKGSTSADRRPKVEPGAELAAGSAPEAPGPKPGVVPGDAEPKEPQKKFKEGGNGGPESVKRGKMAKAAPMPGAPAPAPQLPKLPGAKPAAAPAKPAGPKLPGAGRAGSPAAPKAPGAPAAKAELDKSTNPVIAARLAANKSKAKAQPKPEPKPEAVQKTAISPRDAAHQAVKLPGVRASVGGTMDTMLAGGKKPLIPGQTISITPIASNPAQPKALPAGGPKIPGRAERRAGATPPGLAAHLQHLPAKK